MAAQQQRQAATPECPAVAPLLSISGLEKRFKGVQALADVSLSLGSCEIRAICGENGAGKSTLVKILTGIATPDGGAVRLNGTPLHLRGPHDAQSVGINLVSQELSVCPDLTVLDNIWLGSREVPFLHKRSALRTRAREVLDRLTDTAIDLDAPVANLTTGERQIVEIARMLARDTRVLILDEPTATLSDKEISQVLEALRAVKAAGRSILYITHRLSEVFELCDTVTVMRNGKVVADCAVADLNRESLIAHMLGRPLGSMYPHQKEEEQANVLLAARGLRIPSVTGPIDLFVPAGRIVCLTGQVGSGVESVVRSIFGLVSDTTGEITVDGRPLPLGRPEAAFAAGIRFVSGDRAEEGIFVDQKVGDNLVATRLAKRARLGILSPPALKREAGRLARAVGVDPQRLNASASELSGGNQQKIAFGRCLEDDDAKMIIMIEPTRGIDVGARADLYKLMREFCDQGYGILVASTDFSEVIGLGDVIMTFFRGAVVRIYGAKTVTMPQIIADVTHPEG